MPKFIPYIAPYVPDDKQLDVARSFYEQFRKRRSVRSFAAKQVHRELLQTIVATAGTAPSGANKQPWKFVIVTDPALKQKIRIAAEKEEHINYEQRMSQQWLDDLSPLGTDWHKEFLEIAPALIVVFTVEYKKQENRILKHYYVKESVGIAVGLLLAAIHNAGLVSLTHTPSPMNFLQTILKRPDNERPYLLIPVGYPADQVEVPDIQRKSVEEILVWQ